MLSQKIIYLIASYLAGSIPTGYIVAKIFADIDIRKEGSHNVGATNVFRVVGIRAGMITLAVDFLKGYGPIQMGERFFPEHSIIIIAAGLLAILGHMWPIFLAFTGGKGVATAAGVFLALLPVPTLIAVGVFLVVVALWRTISLGSLSAAVVLPLVTWLMGESLPLVIFSTLIGLLVIIRHASNIKRLVKGDESMVPPMKEIKH